MEFIEEAKEWLKQYNYELHAYSTNMKSATFSCFGEKYMPSIDCYINELGEKRCKITDCISYKLFLSLQTGEIAFKHKDIEQYIEIFIHYAKMAQHKPPW